MIPRLLALAALVLPLTLAAACGGGGNASSGGGSGAAEGGEPKISGDQFRLSGTQKTAQFTVGSKNFPEQEVLGAIAVQALEAADATVIDRTGLGGNEEVRRALIEDEIDLYWEYTATGWLVHLGETRSIPDPQRLYEAVARQDLRENGIEWLEPAPGNDTYAIAASEETLRRLDIRSISDLGRLVEERPEEATLCFNNDDGFRTRFDGLPGMERAYGFRFPEDNLVEVALNAVYGAAADAEICNFGVVFTTSGFIEEEGLQLLEDDRDFFAVYNPAITMHRDTLQNYPQLEELFAPISRGLDTGTLRRLNHAVEVEGETPDAVAERWLTEEGFVE